LGDRPSDYTHAVGLSGQQWSLLCRRPTGSITRLARPPVCPSVCSVRRDSNSNTKRGKSQNLYERFSGQEQPACQFSVRKVKDEGHKP